MIRILNILLPVIFKVFPGRHKLISKSDGKEPEFIVSLTTFPLRIKKLWLTIESILRQKEKPDKLLLWLWIGEFPDKKKLPGNLLKQEERGLEIRFCDDNLMPHKKYFYTMQEYPEANVIIVDDDIIYPPNLLKKIKAMHSIYPDAIISPIIRQIKIIDDNIQSYQTWDYIRTNKPPAFQNLALSGGGTLFPKNSLHPDVFDINTLKEIAITADDLWLKIMSIRKETKVLSMAGEYSRFFIPIIFKENKKLMDINISKGGNDSIFYKLVEKYRIPVSGFK